MPAFNRRSFTREQNIEGYYLSYDDLSTIYYYNVGGIELWPFMVWVKSITEEPDPIEQIKKLRLLNVTAGGAIFSHELLPASVWERARSGEEFAPKSYRDGTPVYEPNVLYAKTIKSLVLPAIREAIIAKTFNESVKVLDATKAEDLSTVNAVLNQVIKRILPQAKNMLSLPLSYTVVYTGTGRSDRKIVPPAPQIMVNTLLPMLSEQLLLQANAEKLAARYLQLSDPASTIKPTAWSQDPLSNPFLIIDPGASTPEKTAYVNVARNLSTTYESGNIVFDDVIPGAYSQDARSEIERRRTTPGADQPPPAQFPWLAAGIVAAGIIAAQLT